MSRVLVVATLALVGQSQFLEWLRELEWGGYVVGGALAGLIAALMALPRVVEGARVAVAAIATATAGTAAWWRQLGSWRSRRRWSTRMSSALTLVGDREELKQGSSLARTGRYLGVVLAFVVTGCHRTLGFSGAPGAGATAVLAGAAVTAAAVGAGGAVGELARVASESPARTPEPMSPPKEEVAATRQSKLPALSDSTGTQEEELPPVQTVPVEESSSDAVADVADSDASSQGGIHKSKGREQEGGREKKPESGNSGTGTATVEDPPADQPKKTGEPTLLRGCLAGTRGDYAKSTKLWDEIPAGTKEECIKQGRVSCTKAMFSMSPNTVCSIRWNGELVEFNCGAEEPPWCTVPLK